MFGVSEKDGHWGPIKEIPGKVNDLREVNSMSCGSPGNCTVGGTLIDGHGEHAILASEKNGSWGRAFRVPGLVNVSPFLGEAAVTSVSCTSAGNCLAGGFNTDASTRIGAFVVSEKRGRWGKAISVSRVGRVWAVSRSSAGNCSAGGISHSQAFVITERNGIWASRSSCQGRKH